MRRFIPAAFLLSLTVVFSVVSFSEQPLASEDRDELLSIVERSCHKACLDGRGREAYCNRYCGCVRSRVEKLSEDTDITAVLEKNSQQQTLIQQCSGETAVQLFSQSCREKCKGAAKCNGYCSCLEGKITENRKFTDIGLFFIRLGKNEEDAVGALKRFETVCTKQ